MALWIVAVPIGTLDDLSPRARRVLADADVIAAESTRTTRKLLSALDIPAPDIVALHGHNEDEIAADLAARALDSEVVVVPEAGSPTISDPGGLLVDLAHQHEVTIRSVPGPSAAVAALAASGLPTHPFVFLGFAPRTKRAPWVREALERPETLVIFESPRRLVDLLERMAALQPDRPACVGRELSKRYEENRQGTLAALAAEFGGRPEVRGECVLVVGAGEPLPPETTELEGERLKDVARVLADRWGVSTRDAYQRLLALERDD